QTACGMRRGVASAPTTGADSRCVTVFVRARTSQAAICRVICMKLTAPWHRKAPSQIREPRPSSLDAISAQLDELSHKVDRLERVHPPVEPPVPSGDSIQSARSGFRGIVAPFPSADPMANLHLA